MTLDELCRSLFGHSISVMVARCEGMPSGGR